MSNLEQTQTAGDPPFIFQPPMAPSADLRIFFLPFLSPGHMIPMLDIATLFARRGAAATIITTPGNACLVQPTISNSANFSNPIKLLLISFPSSTLSGAENMASLSLADFEALFTATFTLRQPLLDLLLTHLPDCLISDSIFSWAADIAADLAIPHLVFHGPGAFALCVNEALEQHPAAATAVLAAYRGSGGGDVLAIEGLPHRIELTPSQVPESFISPHLLQASRVAEAKSYGVVVNSFHELEREYADLYRKSGRRVWLVGPVSLATDRGRAPDRAFNKWLSWLDGRPGGSVLYVCFGSLLEMTANQIQEITAGLEASDHPFIWAAKGSAAATCSSEKGLFINEWVSQVEILSHPAVGGFMTHCGWNSTLEAVAAGVPMATLPMFYEQYINEKLVTDVLRVGVRVREKGGGRNWITEGEEEMRREEVAAAVRRVMGEEAEGMRVRVRELGKKARAAMEEGGSSEVAMGSLLGELAAFRAGLGGDFV